MRPTALPTVHVLYENPAWLPPLLEGLEAEGLPFRTWHLDQGLIDPSEPPPDGLWWNRLSPSSHTRGHAGSVELGRQFLYWLESHGRRVINGSGAFELEMSKLRQDIVFRRHGIRTPKTVLAVGRDQLLEVAEQFEGAFLTKHDQGGKGLGIHLLNSLDELRALLEHDDWDAGPGERVILQEYIAPAGGFVTRVEIVGDRFLFAMRSSTAGGFELCPSDACQLPPASPDVCPAEASGDKFQLSPLTKDDPLVQSYLRLTQAEGIDLAGIEFVENAAGERFTYDLNGTTNYSGVLGKKIGIDGMREVARALRRETSPSATAFARLASATVPAAGR